MKYPVLIFAPLALSLTAVYAESESAFSKNTNMLHIPHVIYNDSIYDVLMKYQAPDKLILESATPLQVAPENSPVKVTEKEGKLKFKLVDIDVDGQSFRADVERKDGLFTADGIALAIHGKMLKGELITGLGYLVDGSFSYAYGVSDDGKSIAGRSRNADRDTVPVRFNFDQEEIEALNGFGGERSAGRAINNSSTIAGFSSLKGEDDAPVIYNSFYNKRGKELIKIEALGDGADSRAYAINNNDVVVGWSASKTDNSDHVAYSFDTASSTMTEIGPDILGGKRSFAFGINDSNQITGVALTDNGSALAFLHENGTTKDLGSLDNSGYSEARGINDKGHVVGWSLGADGNYHAFIHDGTEMKKLPNLGGDTKAFGINTHGHVVGDARGPNEERHAFLYKDGQMIDIYDLLPAADKANWKELREAFSISDDGVIVGRGRYWKDKANEKNTSMAFRIKL